MLVVGAYVARPRYATSEGCVGWADAEAIRDLVRAREAAMEDLREKRQQLQSFLLRHGRLYPGLRSWTLVHARWLSSLTFEHPAQYLVLREYRQAIEDAEARLERLKTGNTAAFRL
jgi:hypothetical protein